MAINAGICIKRRKKERRGLIGYVRGLAKGEHINLKTLT